MKTMFGIYITLGIVVVNVGMVLAPRFLSGEGNVTEKALLLTCLPIAALLFRKARAVQKSKCTPVLYALLLCTLAWDQVIQTSHFQWTVVQAYGFIGMGIMILSAFGIGMPVRQADELQCGCLAEGGA